MPGLLWAESIEVGTRQAPGFGRVQLIGTELFRGQDSTQDIRLVTNSYHGQSANELYLDFDQPLPLHLRDSAGNYQIEEPNYIFSPEARMGSGAALFNRIENRVVISAPEELWPGHGRLHDFSIEMWLRPVYFYRRNVIFRKYSLLDGKKIGLEIYIYRQQLHVSLWNLFTGPDNQLHSVTLVSPGQIGLNRWSHIALSYTATNGKLMLAVNGNEQDTQIAGDRQGVWTGAFHALDRTPIIIGESYSGLLDELRIARTDLSTHATHPNNQLQTSVYPALEVDYESMRGEQKAGMVISEVIHPEGRHGSRSGRIRYQSSQPTGT
ncbi:MAG: LamG domain-containing protein, partial [Leptospiraceae bacterium]|nr:LamG domain-containing protein [Leptospiraceae bacterium]